MTFTTCCCWLSGLLVPVTPPAHLLFSLVPIAVMWPTLVVVVLLGKCVNKTLLFTLRVWKLKHNVKVYETSMHFNEARLMDGLWVTLLILNSISYYGYLYSWNWNFPDWFNQTAFTPWKYWRMTDDYHPPQIDFFNSIPAVCPGRARSGRGTHAGHVPHTSRSLQPATQLSGVLAALLWVNRRIRTTRVERCRYLLIM